MKYYLTWNYRQWPAFSTREAMQSFIDFWKLPLIGCDIKKQMRYKGFVIEDAGAWEKKYGFGNFMFHRPGDESYKYGESIADCVNQIEETLLIEVE